MAPAAPAAPLNSKPGMRIKVRQDTASPSFVTSKSTVATQTTASFNFITTTPIPAPSPTPTISNPGPAPSLPPNNGGPIIGGVVGGFLGTLLLIFLLWKGCWDPNLNYPYRSYDDDDDSSTTSRSSRVRRRGGGGEEEYRMHHHHGRSGYGADDIKRPARVYSRRERDREKDTYSHGYSGGRRSSRRRSRRTAQRRSNSRLFEVKTGGIFGPPRYKVVTRGDIRRWRGSNGSGERRSRGGDLKFDV